MTGTYYAYDLIYYLEKANNYLNTIHREIFRADRDKQLSSEVRLYLDAINKHVRAINSLLDSGASE